MVASMPPIARSTRLLSKPTLLSSLLPELAILTWLNHLEMTLLSLNKLGNSTRTRCTSSLTSLSLKKLNLKSKSSNLRTCKVGKMSQRSRLSRGNKTKKLCPISKCPEKKSKPSCSRSTMSTSSLLMTLSKRLSCKASSRKLSTWLTREPTHHF